MNQFNKTFISFILVVSLFFVGSIGNKTANASNLLTETADSVHQETATENEESETLETQTPIVDRTKEPFKDGNVETQDWYTVTTEYGTPVSKGDVTLSNKAPVDAYKNKSSTKVKYSQTHSVKYSSSWSASAGATLNLSKLNTKMNGKIGVAGGKSYSFTRKFEMNLAPGKGIQIKKLYRKYQVPTYKVTKYSASMGGRTEKKLVGNTFVYVPIGMVSYDY